MTIGIIGSRLLLHLIRTKSNKPRTSTVWDELAMMPDWSAAQGLEMIKYLFSVKAPVTKDSEGRRGRGHWDTQKGGLARPLA